MYFLRQNRYILVFLAMLVFCSIMAIRQFRLNDDRRLEVREAFILLHSRGYASETRRLFQKLLDDVPKLTGRQLMDDVQRTMNLVDPSIRNENNLIWKYHWTVSNELEKRSEKTLQRALQLAEEAGK
jgi:hypothetical protein